MVGDTFQLSTAHLGDAIRAADPQDPALVLDQLVDTVAGEAVSGCKVAESSRAGKVQTAVTRSKPQPAVWVLMDCPNLFALQGFGDRITLKLVEMQAAQAAVGSDPNVAVPVLHKRAGAEVAKPVAHLIILKSLTSPSADAFIGADPNVAIPALSEGANEVIDQSGFSGVVMQPLAVLVIDPLSFSSDPEAAQAVTKHIADPDSTHAGKTVGRGFPLRKTEKVRCRNPNLATAVFVHGLSVGI